MNEAENPTVGTETTAGETFATAAAPPPATGAQRKKRGPRTDSLAGVRRQHGAVYRELLAWNPPDMRPEHRIARARALSSILAAIGQAIRDGDVEARLAALEEASRVGRAH